MKKLLCLVCVLGLLLCGCTGAATDPTEPATTVPTTTLPPTEPPTEPPTTEPPTEPPTTEPPVIYTNPLNGEELAEPYTGRIFASTINNISPALPYIGVSHADMLFEMLINDYATRCVALFSDIQSVPVIGSVRSSRMNFVDICQAYDAILGHAGYGNGVQSALNNRGVNHIHLGNVAGYRDQGRLNSGYALEHTLVVNGQTFFDTAVKNGFDVVQPVDKDYGLTFTADGTPENGEAASELHVSFWGKMSHFYFNEETGTYDFYLHGDYVTDETNGQRISFENVIVMQCYVYNDYVYHIADLNGSGNGYYACNGQIIPIQWHHESQDAPFTFTLADGTPLELGVGKTYVAFAPSESTFEYQ